MLLTVRGRWSRCCSFSVWVYGLFCLALLLFLSSCFFVVVVFFFDVVFLMFFFFSVLLALLSHRLWKRELVYVLLVHLFVNFARLNLCPWYQGLAAACDCDTPWTFSFFFFFFFFFFNEAIFTCSVAENRLMKLGDQKKQPLPTRCNCFLRSFILLRDQVWA